MNVEAAFLEIRNAARALNDASLENKNSVLLYLAESLKRNQDFIIAENQKDLDGLSADTTNAFRDRLTLTPSRIDGMAASLVTLAKFPDPVGEVTEKKILENGLIMNKTRVPLGVILMIFESRPNVAIEAFALAFKSGNVIVLKPGKESANTVNALAKLVHEALASKQFSRPCATFITSPDREIIRQLLQCKKEIDVVIPRGGENLIRFVSENTSIPVIKNDRGMCHIYVDEDADLGTALSIIKNAKTQRPGVCNAAETVLIHSKVKTDFLPKLFNELSNVEFRLCDRSHKLLPANTRTKHATKEDFDTEHLDLILNCKIVDSLESAIAHIENHGSKHSEAIVTRNEKRARLFQKLVDAAAVYWNASTRFTDGFEFGLGGEIGVSTQKLHVRGPVGLTALTCEKWVIDGKGQTRI